ncbi:MAG: DEAD/DEAH box helicase [Staphylococcus sp.]|nr:DEAD/DEAH box helicase [Staphylococcus sp.]
MKKLILDFIKPYWVTVKGEFNFIQEKVKPFIGSKFDSKNKIWKFRIDYLHLFSSLLNYCNIICTDNLNQAYQEFVNKKNISEQIKNLEIKDYKQFCKKELDKIQIQGALWLNFIKKGIIAFGTGVGKTFTALEACCLLNSCNDKYKKILIVTLNQITTQWEEQIQENFSNLKIFNVNNYKDRKKCYSEFENYNKLSCLVINFEKIRIDLPMLEEINFDVIVIDEASKIKSTSLTTNKKIKGQKKQLNNRGSLKELCKKVDYVFGLTATPYETNYYNYFGIFNVIDEDLFSGGFTRFQERYFLKDFFGRYSITNKDNELELTEFIKPYIFSKKIDLGVKVNCQKIDLNFTEQDLKNYKAIYEDMKAELMVKKPFLGNVYDVEQHIAYEKEINESIGFLAVNPQYQFCDFPSIVYPEKYNDNYSPKLDWVLKNIKNFKGKTIIFDSRTESTDRICKSFDKNDIKYFCIDGTISLNKRNIVIKKLKESNDTHILVCSDCLSYGVNLQFCSNMVFFNLAYNPAVLSQRAGRIIRRGQKNEVFIYILSMKDTREEKICKTINSRINEAETITNGKLSLKRKDLVKFIEEK